MKEFNISDSELINALKAGRKEQEKALKQLVLDEDLNTRVSEKLLTMGGRETDRFSLIDEALIDLVREINKGSLDEGFSITGYVFDRITKHWIFRLGKDDLKRKQVMNHIANDNELKNRVLIKMKKLGCQELEAEDYYNQGFLKLNEVLSDKKYKGGDVKGLFYRICEFLRLNDRRKVREVLPEFIPEKVSHDIEKILERKERKEQLIKWLKKIGEKCKETLQMWNDGFSMKEIAEAIPYKDHLEAAVAKHRCMKKLFNQVDIH